MAYALTAELVYRGLCLVNFVAFVGFYAQFKGLCASGGISPTSEHMKRVRAKFPSSVLPPWPFSQSTADTRKKKDKYEDEDEDGDEEKRAKKEQKQEIKTLTERMKMMGTWISTLRRNLWSRAYSFPTLFWFSSSDWMHYVVFALGMSSAVLGFFGFGWPPINLMLCWVCYLSFHVVGQPWLGLQMHVTLLESNMVWSLGTLAAYFSWTLQRILNYYLGYPQFVASTYSPFVAVFLMRFLVWRIMLGCGACKYGSGDRTWRDLTAMDYHYFTQPLPNPWSWYMARLPHSVHAIAVIATHVIEGPLTFLAFGTTWMRIVAFIGFAGLNVSINVTGNYGYLGLLTVVESISVLDDDILHAVIPRMLIPFQARYAVDPPFSLLDYLIIPALTLPYLLTSLIPLISTFHGKIPFYPETISFLSRQPVIGSRVPSWDAALRGKCTQILRSPLARKTLFRVLDKCEEWHDYLYPFHIINRYAKFGTMTTKRWEIILEGSDNGEEWREFDFKYKVGDPKKRPVFCPLHLPGIDWQIWFLPTRLAVGSRAGWLFKLIEAMLHNKKDVMDLLGPSPFDHAPRFIQLKLYDYKFCFDENQKEKLWWKRKLLEVHGRFALHDGKMVEILPPAIQGR